MWLWQNYVTMPTRHPSFLKMYLVFFFRTILSAIQSECRTVWIQIRPDVLSLVGKELTISKMEIYSYSKTCVKRPLKNRQNKGLYNNW